MGVSNFDVIAAASATLGGLPAVAAIGKGTTPATGWTTGTGHAFKDVTVAGAAVNDVVICTLNAVAFLGTPAELRYVQGYVTGADTVRIYYSSLNFAGGGSAGATTIPGVVSFVVVRPT